MIKFNNISLNFNGKPIFTNFDMNIKENEKVIIAGRSGIGKSSLFSLLLGFLEPDKGSIFFSGKELNSSNIWDIRNKISYVDQDAVSGTGKVSDWIKTICDFKYNKESGLSLKKVIEESKKLNMNTECFDKDISELSGGERQRISISLALASGKNVFLLDEITSALDNKLKFKVAEIFLNMKNSTVVAVSHDPIWTNNGNAKVFDLEEMKWKQ